MRVRHLARYRWLLAPLVLCCVAVNQQILAHTEGLTSWKGGGFGMFADIDRPATRTFTLTLTLDDGAELAVPLSALSKIPGWVDQFDRTRTYPDTATLRELADAALTTTYHVTPGPSGSPVFSDNSDDPDARPVVPAAVTVRVWAPTYEPDTGTVTGRIVAQLTREAP